MTYDLLLIPCCYLIVGESWVRPRGGAGPLCVEFTYSPHVWVGFLWVLWLFPTGKKNMQVRLIGGS